MIFADAIGTDSLLCCHPLYSRGRTPGFGEAVINSRKYDRSVRENGFRPEGRMQQVPLPCQGVRFAVMNLYAFAVVVAYILEAPSSSSC